MKLEKQLLLDENRGIYIPKKFAENFDTKAWHLTKDQVKCLKAGPDSDDYWEAWDEVLASAHFHDENKVKWTLEQDGDLFAIPEGLYTEEEEEEEIEEEEKVHPGLHEEMKKEENPSETVYASEPESTKIMRTILSQGTDPSVKQRYLAELVKNTSYEDAANSLINYHIVDNTMLDYAIREMLESEKIKPRAKSRLLKKLNLIRKAHDLLDKAEDI